ncbi:MAG TPA: response regulator transcription factor [Gaiellaceae bacterium]|nr:response regulator transcription factor [Gaiellaceae bacterium]
MQSTENARTCLVADDHPSVLRTVTELLRAWGWTIVASTSNGDEALAKIEELRPRVALLDLQLPGLDGIDIVRSAARVAPETAVVIYTGKNDSATVREALDAGVKAFVVKEAPLEGLKRALDTVADGGRYVDPVVSAALLLEPDGASLTDRERAVLRLIADGYSYEEAGKELFISPETVRAHVAKSLTKLGARSRTHAVAEALRAGLIA